jgi:ligand-binding SRPBCC domain-containing protein
VLTIFKKSIFVIYNKNQILSMSLMQNQIEIIAPIERVFEYYTNPDNIKESWPHDIVKESENVSGQKSEEGSEMKITGEYMGKKDEMTLEVVQKEQNKRLVTKQTKEGPFQRWKNIQELQSSGSGNTTTTTLVNHIINYELPTIGKIANVLTGSQAENKIRQGREQAAQTVKQRLESV